MSSFSPEPGRSTLGSFTHRFPRTDFHMWFFHVLSRSFLISPGRSDSSVPSRLFPHELLSCLSLCPSSARVGFDLLLRRATRCSWPAGRCVSSKRNSAPLCDCGSEDGCPAAALLCPLPERRLGAQRTFTAVSWGERAVQGLGGVVAEEDVLI